MLIGIISDTHDNVDAIDRAVRIFKEYKVDLVLHLGDIVAPMTISNFDGLNIKFVRGNNDGDILNIKKRIEEIGGDYLGDIRISTYYLLMGYAVENLLKAILMIEQPEYFKEESLPKVILSHNLNKMNHLNYYSNYSKRYSMIYL